MPTVWAPEAVADRLIWAGEPTMAGEFAARLYIRKSVLSACKQRLERGGPLWTPLSEPVVDFDGVGALLLSLLDLFFNVFDLSGYVGRRGPLLLKCPLNRHEPVVGR